MHARAACVKHREGAALKLSLLSYQICKDHTLDEMIALARKAGFSALEFRIDMGHRHGVELSLSKAERTAVKTKLEDAYLVTACVGTGYRYESPDPAARQKMIDLTKRAIELAADLNCPRVRVFGNDMPKGVDREDCIRYVGESLRELGEFADPYDVDVLLEMHGQFNFWGFAKRAVMTAAHPRVGIVYNCDMRDVHGGSIRDTYLQVRAFIRHVHMHDIASPFPYDELFAYLVADNYTGYLSPEIDASPDPETVIRLYAALAREKWNKYLPAGVRRQ